MTEMVREVALINANGCQNAADFAFAVEAIRIQVERDYLPAWRDYLPIGRPVSVVGYNDTKNLALGSFAPIVVMPSLGNPQFLGDHGGLELSDSAWGRTQPISTVESHEALELIGDTFGNRWVRLPSGMVVAKEDCDAVENDTYPIEATVGGQTRTVLVSNFVHPAWYGEGTGQLDQKGVCTAPGENRGYLIVEGEDGTTTNVFAALGREYVDKVTAKLKDEKSRTYQRHARVDDRVYILPNVPKITGHSWC